MRLILFFIAASLSAQVTGSLHEVLPNRANADTGSVRLWNDTQTYKVDVRAVADQITNKVFRIPSENATAVATENHRYGTDSFTITGIKAGGTESSPSDVTSGAVLFQFMGMARSGGAEVNAGSITFGVDAASPLDTSINFGLAVGGSYGTRFGMDKDRFYGVGRPELGMSAAGGRWGTLYGDSADFLVPTGSTPQYETGSFIRAQSLELYDSAGYSGGFKLQVTNTPAGNSKMEILDATASPVFRFIRADLSGTPVAEIDSYMSIIPATIATYDLGSSSKPWSFIYGATIESTATLKVATGAGLGVDTDFLPTADLTYKLGDTGRRWDEAWIGTLNVDSCVGCGSGGSGGYPLGEAVVTDFFGVHGGDNTCTADCTAAFQAAVDSLGTARGGKVTAPPGCYLVSGSIIIGDGQPSSTCSRGIGDPWYTCLSTVNSVTIEGAGTVVNAGTHPGGTFTDAATEIRWDSAVTPGSATPIFKFQGPISGGGLKNMYVNLNNTANVYGVEQIQHNRATFEDLTFVTGRRLVWNSTTNNNNNNAFLGSCGSRYVNIIIDKPGSGQSGLSLDGGVPGLDSCSNTFIGGSFVRDANTSGTYSLKLRYADNNTFLRTNFLAYPLGTSSSDPDVLFEQYSGSTDFPKENYFLGNSTHFGFGGTSGTGWNTIENYQWQDCAVTLNCIEFSMAYLRGTVDGKSFSSAADPPGPKFPHGTGSAENTFKVWQSNGGNNSVGAIAFQRYTDPIQFRISGNTSSGLSIWTATHLGTLTERWQFRGDGHLLPVTTNALDLGGLSNKLRAVYATTLNAQDVFSSTLNTYTPTSISSGVQSNYLRADVSNNIYCEAYAATGSTTERCAFHFYRLGGYYGAESAVGNSWRLGGVFAWGHPSTTPSVGIEFYAASSGVSGTGIVPGEMRLSTQDSSGTRATRWILKANGAIEPNLNATYDIGSSSFTAGHIYTNNITINGTCSGSGCGGSAPSNMMTTDTNQTASGVKTWSSQQIFNSLRVYNPINSTFSNWVISQTSIAAYDNSANIRYLLTNADGITNWYFTSTDYASVAPSIGWRFYIGNQLRSQLGSTLNMYNSSGLGVFSVSAAGAVTAGSTITSASGFVVGSAPGITGVITIGGCSIAVNGGLVTNTVGC